MTRQSLTDAIMTRYLEGKRVCQIAREVGCTPANVSNTIKRNILWNGHVTPTLPEPVLTWIADEAIRLDKSMAAVVRDLIISEFTRIKGKIG